eukprot:CAMPEP_0171091820 /NCGR_PEP_ID=MMETSP0766_2-20121228/35341_1 /TAXON_ID=439317 /ORGANISM="Gambierdiscus australes, Strain CAWD 149" /LENGTH=346 /DNA_ID=CAMNT_0011549989 /DNA_START=33 /DNA_END=1073 /DNA_ORIENTATION=-
MAQTQMLRKSDPTNCTASSDQLWSSAGGTAQSASIRSSLGQRGGVVKKSDAFDVFYGLVGDQPGRCHGSADSTASALPQPASATAAPSAASQQQSVLPALGKRGGVVRKSDGFEVFYGLVGDQPATQGSPKPAKEDDDEAPADTAQTQSEEDFVKESQHRVALDAAMFSLATPAASFAPGIGNLQSAEMMPTLPENVAAGALLRRLEGHGKVAPQETSTVPEFSLATPASSFSPQTCSGKRWEDRDGVDEFLEELGDLPARLNAVSTHFAADIYSIATPAASLAHGNYQATLPIKEEEPVVEEAGFPDFFRSGNRCGAKLGRESTFQLRLDSLDGAIARLRALQGL